MTKITPSVDALKFWRLLTIGFVGAPAAAGLVGIGLSFSRYPERHSLSEWQWLYFTTLLLSSLILAATILYNLRLSKLIASTKYEFFEVAQERYVRNSQGESEKLIQARDLPILLWLKLPGGRLLEAQMGGKRVILDPNFTCRQGGGENPSDAPR